MQSSNVAPKCPLCGIPDVDDVPLNCMKRKCGWSLCRWPTLKFGRKNVREIICELKCGLKEMWKTMGGPRCEAQMWLRIGMQSSSVALMQCLKLLGDSMWPPKRVARLKCGFVEMYISYRRLKCCPPVMYGSGVAPMWRKRDTKLCETQMWIMGEKQISLCRSPTLKFGRKNVQKHYGRFVCPCRDTKCG